MVGGVSSIELTVHDPYSAEDIAQSIANSTGLNALSWITTNSQFFLAMRAQTYSSLLIRFSLLCRWQRASPVCWWSQSYSGKKI
jgi:lipoprotein-releasing system permease protein